ncbi:hypothetical protein J3P89_03190 [Pseudomonas sp. Z1-14]|uniref:CPCC family cysteine-rich protein n=1 Tax=Pseudomonas sp. Z1-14 TaxID=2817409 RepID=UPI003DA9B937
MKKIFRFAAIKTITENTLKLLTTEERHSLLLNWWTLDESDAIFFSLSKELQNTISNNDEPPKNLEDLLIEELLLAGLKSSYTGVTNEYLADQLARLENEAFYVEGDKESLHACPCCEYHTLLTTSNYEICDLCNWEDDGTTTPESFSHPNHMTLSDAKKAFREKSKNLQLNKWAKTS